MELTKILNIVPDHLEKAADDGYAFIAKTWIPAMLVTVSAGLETIKPKLAVPKD